MRLANWFNSQFLVCCPQRASMDYILKQEKKHVLLDFISSGDRR